MKSKGYQRFYTRLDFPKDNLGRVFYLNPEFWNLKPKQFVSKMYIIKKKYVKPHITVVQLQSEC